MQETRECLERPSPERQESKDSGPVIRVLKLVTFRPSSLSDETDEASAVGNVGIVDEMIGTVGKADCWLNLAGCGC